MKQIPLSQGFSATVDDEDFEWLRSFRWHTVKHRTALLARTRIDGKFAFMHQLVIRKYEQQAGFIYGRNGSLLDCRRQNLYQHRPQMSEENRRLIAERNREMKKGKHFSPLTEFKKGVSSNTPNRLECLARGEEHWKWQDVPSYSAVHVWIKKQLGAPNECQDCGLKSDNSRQFHWSNKSGDYLRDVEDWQRLCIPCHRKYDSSSEMRGASLVKMSKDKIRKGRVL